MCISHFFTFIFFIYQTNIFTIACFFCCSSIIVPVVGLASAKRTWFLNQVADILESINRNRILCLMGKLDTSDRILQLAVELFPKYQTLETGLIRYSNNLFVLRTMRNLKPIIESGNSEDALDTVATLSFEICYC